MSMKTKFQTDVEVQGMSLVGVLVTLSVLSVGIIALMNVQHQFSSTTKNVEIKESIIQEATNKVAILQSNDYLKIMDTCRLYALNGTEPGDCSNLNSTSTHTFLYRWYKVDALYKICLDITSCNKIASGKMLEVAVGAHHEVNGKRLKTILKFRKAK